MMEEDDVTSNYVFSLLMRVSVAGSGFGTAQHTLFIHSMYCINSCFENVGFYTYKLGD